MYNCNFMLKIRFQIGVVIIMPPKRSHEASDDDVESQGAKIIRFVSPNSDDVKSHEAI